MKKNSPALTLGLDLPALCREESKRPAYIPVFRCSLVKEGRQAAERKQITQPEDAAALLAAYLADADREHLVVLLLDNKNQVLGINTVTVGVVNASLSHPREIFKPAILAGAASIIVGHNHPSGDPSPSPEDKTTTRRCYQAGEIIGIDLLDHVIIGDAGRFVSLKSEGVF